MEVRQARGELAGERSYATNDGERKFAPGDRIIFLENNRDLGVKNGMIGTVENVEGRAADGEAGFSLLPGKKGRGGASPFRWPIMPPSITAMRRQFINPRGRRSIAPSCWPRRRWTGI